MTWPTYDTARDRIKATLVAHSRAEPMPGIADPDALNTLSLQIIASQRREKYFDAIQNRGEVLSYRADPHDDKFEAELGVVHLLQQQNFEEAAWLVFLMTCFGKPAATGWRRLRDVYGLLGQGTADWRSVAARPDLIEIWLGRNWRQVRGTQGSHRKYESLRPNSARPIGKAITQYVRWILSEGGHRARFASLVRSAGNSPEAVFDHFYNELPCSGFARLGRFDWVAMLDRYGFINAIPETAYLDGATGPLRGTSLLFTGDPKRQGVTIEALQKKLTKLDEDLKVGMKVLEDSLCNWQKNPRHFVHFKG